MPIETTLASNDDLDRLLQEMSPMPIMEGLHETGAYACALQALRDVRHLLPCEGVAIVDAVLDPVP
jgi:hypothetical protein